MASSAWGPNRNLASLDELDDFKVADEDPDPRGWDIFAEDGRRIGEVDELIVDTSAMKVRYLDCDLDEAELGIEDRERHVLIPLDNARLDENAKRVTVEGITSEDVAMLPPFTGDLSADYDAAFSARMSSRGTSSRQPQAEERIRSREVRLRRGGDDIVRSPTDLED